MKLEVAEFAGARRCASEIMLSIETLIRGALRVLRVQLRPGRGWARAWVGLAKGGYPWKKTPPGFTVSP